MKSKELVSIISGVYDAALEPSLWPELLLEIAHLGGAKGAMLFEVVNAAGKDRIISPLFSENYDYGLVSTYLHAFNDLELIDQARFATLSAAEDRLMLVNDVEFYPSPGEFEERKNIRAMMKNGLKHRAGALLNMDCWSIDRFALQYGAKRGPASDAEKATINALLPHIAKALRVGRPLTGSLTPGAFQARVAALEFGVAIIDAHANLILSNMEFDRILDVHAVFTMNRAGQLKLRDTVSQEKYNRLIADEQAHGVSGARPRNEAVTFEVDRGALFVEICPTKSHEELGSFPPGSRLITVFDSSRQHGIDLEIVRRFFHLSETELAVLEMIGLGLSNVEIADARGRSPETVNSQIKTIFRKTNTHNRTELVQLAVSLNSPFSRRWFS